MLLWPQKYKIAPQLLSGMENLGSNRDGNPEIKVENEPVDAHRERKAPRATAGSTGLNVPWVFRSSASLHDLFVLATNLFLPLGPTRGHYHHPSLLLVFAHVSPAVPGTRQSSL